MNWNISTEEGMANAVAWTENLVSAMADKSVWGIPRSGTVVHIDKPAKTVTIQSVLPDPAVPKVFKAMGWTVLDQQSNA